MTTGRRIAPAGPLLLLLAPGLACGPGGAPREASPPAAEAEAPEREAPRQPDIFTDTSDPREIYRRAYGLYQKQQFNEAARAFLQATRAQEGFVDAHYFAGKSLLKSFPTDNQGAEEQFLRVLELEPEHLDAHIALAQAYHFWGRNEDAARVLEEARRLSPGHRGILYSSGLVAMRLGRDQEAVGYLEKSLEQDPRHVPSLLELAGAYGHLSRDREALELYERALTLQPRNVTALKGAGTSLQRLGREAEAREMLVRFREVQSRLQDREFQGKKLEVRLRQVEDAYKAGDREAARAAGELVREEFPQNVTGLLELGRLEGQGGDLGRSIQTHMDVLDLQPDNLPAVHRLLELFKRTGDRRRAAAMKARYDELMRRARPGKKR